MPDNLDVPFHVHELADAEGNLGTYLGGGHDAAQATAIACAIYTARQAASVSTDLVIVAVDDAGSTVCFVGKHPVQAG